MMSPRMVWVQCHGSWISWDECWNAGTYICQQTTHFRMQSQNSINEGNMQADGINAAGIGKQLDMWEPLIMEPNTDVTEGGGMQLDSQMMSL